LAKQGSGGLRVRSVLGAAVAVPGSIGLGDGGILDL